MPRFARWQPRPAAIRNSLPVTIGGAAEDVEQLRSFAISVWSGECVLASGKGG